MRSSNAKNNENNGGGHLENWKNRSISATEQPILTKFGTVMFLGPTDTACQ